MTKQQATDFVNRWRMVDSIIVDEIRNAAPETKAQQIASAYQTAAAMKLTAQEVPFQQWQRLREKLNGR